MFSTTIELAGLACLVAGAFVLAGIGVALLVACPVLLFVGATTGDDVDTAISRAVKGAAARVGRVSRAAVARAFRRRPKVA